jgi:hypothetical protein
MHVFCYCFTEAADKDAAIANVETFCTDCGEREFFDAIQPDEEQTKPLEDVPEDELAKLYDESRKVIRSNRKAARAAAKAGDTITEAYASRKLSDLLWANMCPDMPYFNIDDYSYDLPDDKKGWWAVMVNFHY